MPMTETAIAWWVALGGWTLAIVQTIVGYVERRDSRRIDLVNAALSYLTGGTQKRSVGIAMIEGMWETLDRFHNALVPALTNQAVYLLLHADNAGSRHEIHNWLRIMDILIEKADLSRHGQSRGELSNALHLRVNGHHDEGIDLPAVSLARWAIKVGVDVEEPTDNETVEQADPTDGASRRR